MNLSRTLPIAIASACLGALAMMAMQARPAQAQQAQMMAAPVQVQQQAPALQAPAAAQPQPMFQQAAAAQPVVETNHLQVSTIRAPSDEHLPKWVPKRGRLSVVDSSDLAENLGIVPKGTTKASAERISAAGELEKQEQARAAQHQSDPNNYASPASFSYSKAGRFRSRL